MSLIHQENKSEYSKNINNQEMDRREFLKNVTRGSILAGLGLVTGTLLLKEKSKSSCNDNFICNSCRKLSDCKLPEAISFKETGKMSK